MDFIFQAFPSTFHNTYHCYSIMMMAGRSREDANEGVLEFVADPGHAHIPNWMMKNLAIGEGDQVEIKNVKLPLGSYAKIQPQSVDFLDISNQRAVLEKILRSFACLTEGDMIAINYNSKVYEICVLEVKPVNAARGISIIECDLNIDFAAPLGYVEPERVPRTIPEGAGNGTGGVGISAEDLAKQVKEREEEEISKAVFRTFTGSGARLDGKAPKTMTNAPVVAGPTSEAGRREMERRARAKAAEARFTPNKLKFTRPMTASPKDTPSKSTDATSSTSSIQDSATNGDGGFAAFKGKGRSLKD